AIVLLVAAMSVTAGCAKSAPATPSFDVVLQGGVVVDGTGAPARRADVAITGDRVVAIEPQLRVPAGATVLDVTGLTVAPGFIDPHAHISTIAEHPDAENFVRQGVTTIFNSLHSLDQPHPLGVFLDTLHVAPNTLWSAGHTWARKRVLGLADRAPTADELAQMAALVDTAMRDGAFGLGTGLEYVPAVYARSEEVEALARASARPGALYVTHLRDEGSALEAAIAEALAVGRAAGLPTHISHLKSTGVANWHRMDRLLAHFDSLNAAGARVSFDVYPYTAYSTYSDVLMPAWALAGGLGAFTERARDGATRDRIVREVTRLFAAQTAGTAASVRFRTLPSAPEFVGRTLADYLAATGRGESIADIADALVTLQADGGFTAIVEAMSEADVERLHAHEAGMVSSDGDLVRPGQGFPHPRSYGAFPRVLARYVRERGVLTLEQAIAHMTGVPARTFGLVDRGVLRAGAFADLVVFDAATIADRGTFTEPHQYPVGVWHVFVNGEAVMRGGALTGARPGRALRRPASSRAVR
ncbi:MAG TPA: amidohydrolase family protein, partial [Gemmatimonadaceae bacterium]|nr:amidohydrolase family protein [Gemmatimonadaceae bacterium]